MKLYMKQKVFAWTDKFTVKDEMENDRYYVQGELLSLAKKLHIYDTDQIEVAYIRQKLLALMPRFFVEIGGHEVCQIVQRFTLLRPKYALEGIGWQVEGNFWEHEYAVLDGDREVMRLSKHWFTWGDSYELDIADPNDELICLAIVLAIDAAVANGAAAASAAT